MLSDNPIFRRFWAFRYMNDPVEVTKIVASANEWQAARGGYGVVWSCPAADAASMTLRRTDAVSNVSDLVVPYGEWLLCNGDDGPSAVIDDQFYQRVYRRLAELWDEMDAADRLLADAAFVAAIGATVPAAPTYALHVAEGQGALPALTLLAATATVDVPFDRPLPLSTAVGDVHWAAHASVPLSSISLQAIANPVVLLTNAVAGPPAVPATAVTGVRLFLRTQGVATVAGVVQARVVKLVSP